MFPELDRKSDAIFFGYQPGSWKARAYPEKAFVASPGFKPELWNIAPVLECLASGPSPVYFTEGEMDALSLMEAGIPRYQVTSVPNGAGKPTGEKSTLPPYLTAAFANGLHRASKFIWAGDTDQPGLLMRQYMAEKLGAAKFCYVDWPEGCKDANDVLLKHGPDYLRNLVLSGAKQWPAYGLFTLSELPEPPELELWEPSWPCLQGKMWLAPRTLSVVTGQPGHGKAICVNTDIPTPGGWVKMGDIRVGDAVFDERGEPCRVTFATPAMFGHPCFRVGFDDGSEIIADADHLWLTETEASRQSGYALRRRGGRTSPLPRGTDQSHKRKLPSVVTTAEIAKTLITPNGKRNHAVRLSGPVRYPKAKLPLSPYVLGAWLGDGDSDSAAITCADRDAEIMQFIASEGVPVRRQQYGTRTPRWSMSDGSYSRKGTVTTALRSMGVLGNKHIPAAYLHASIEQRLCLLQGLMDTDGYISKGDGQCEFCSTNEALARGVSELVGSLGVRVKVLIGRAALRGKDCGPKYRVQFSTSLPVFRLKRKLGCVRTKIRRKYRYITSCQPVDSVPVRCIQVDSPSHLYLAGRSFIPTHNTQAFGELWYGIANKYQVVICIASFETRPKPHLQRQIRTLYCGAPEMHLSSEEKALADGFIENQYLFLQHPDQRPSLEWFLDQAEIAVVRHHAKIIQLDPWNRLASGRERDETETEYIARCLRACHIFAHDMNCHIQIVAHPAKLDSHRKGSPPTLEDISGSKHFENMVDQGFVIHREKLFNDDGSRCTEAKFICLKSRFEELGYPFMTKIRYDLAMKRYVPVVEEEEE